MLKCEKCGREFKREGNKIMHEKFCKGKKEITENNKKVINKVKNENKEEKKKEICSHDYIILNENIINQRLAIKDGFNAYCKKCNNLI
jgi:hypothetical protein